MIIEGHLGADPEMRYTANGSAVTNMRVAASERFTTKDGEKQERTEWFSVVCWNKLAEIVGQHLVKGREVLVEGKLQTRSWDQDGQKRYKTEVVASSVVFIGPANGRERDDGAPAIDDDMDVDDLPFDN